MKTEETDQLASEKPADKNQFYSHSALIYMYLSLADIIGLDKQKFSA